MERYDIFFLELDLSALTAAGLEQVVAKKLQEGKVLNEEEIRKVKRAIKGMKK